MKLCDGGTLIRAVRAKKLRVRCLGLKLLAHTVLEAIGASQVVKPTQTTSVVATFINHGVTEGTFIIWWNLLLDCVEASEALAVAGMVALARQLPTTADKTGN